MDPAKRRKSLIVVIAATLAILLGLPYLFSKSFTPPHCQHDAKTLRCVQFVKNYDGDSMRFRIKNVHPILGDGVLVNLRGVQIPQFKSKNKCERERAKIAKSYVRSTLSKASIIHLKNIERKKSSRILADILADGKSLSRLLIRKKLAFPNTRVARKRINWCKKSKRKNRKASLKVIPNKSPTDKPNSK